ncbi:hypothetical protein KL924_001042 [Ogataea haglerorum]|nr:hypothetical protein KL924_001042 [Ogataea haglerorum]
MPSLIPILILLCSRTLEAFYGIISDCDEVFNYWEPLNLITRLFGKQTWEYSPEYAIRSYAYLLPFTVFNKPLRILATLVPSVQIPPYLQFYLVRLSIALLTASAEIHLANTLAYISPDLSNWFLVLQAVNPGMSHASISLLPSSFSMILMLLSTASIVNYLKYDRFILKIQNSINEKLRSLVKAKTSDYDESLKLLNHMYTESIVARKKHFTMAILSAVIGGLLGWPFSLALTIPFGLYVGVTLVSRKSYSQLLTFGGLGFAAVLFISIAILQIDSLFYRETSFVPLNIVLYNVLYSDEKTGPNIFGTEPLIYYIHNLLLNFNFVVPLAVLGILSPVAFERFNLKQIKTVQAPILLWCAIFFFQPHKEERFLYPIYPLITLSASFFISQITQIFGKTCFFARVYTFLCRLAVFMTIFTVSVLRIVSLVSNYSSPLAVFRRLPTSSTNVTENVCIGREWYHYPSSFFLHSNQRLRFVESGFRGMLPGDFIEPSSNSWTALFNSTSTKPQGFNNENRYNPDLVIPFSQCDYYVDLDMPVNPDFGEVQVFDKANALGDWEILVCEKFLDTENSYGVDKILYVPTKEINLLSEWLESLYTIVQDNPHVQNLLSWVKKRYKLINGLLGPKYEAFKRHPYVQKVLNHQHVVFLQLLAGQLKHSIIRKASNIQIPQPAVNFLIEGQLRYHQLCLGKHK